MNKILLKNGLVYLGDNFETPIKKDILIQDKKIIEISDCLEDKTAKVIDLSSKLVLPGFIDAHCHIGIFETGNGEMGVDGNEGTNPITPNLRGIDGINPYDEEFRHCAEHGVTTVVTGPGSANPIGGTFVAMKTAGNTFDDQIIKDPIALKAAFGENPKNVYGKSKKAPETRMAIASLIRQSFHQAKHYMEHNEGPIDEGMENLAKVLKREIPLKCHCHRRDDILTAIRIAKEFNIRITLDHCTEGYLIPNELSYAEGIIIGPMGGFPHKLETKYGSFKSGGILIENDNLVAIMSDLPATHCNFITYEAGQCVAEGMKLDDALKSITINPAKIVGLDNLIGTIEIGKDADITVFDNNPIKSIQAKCLMTIIDGNIVHNKV